MSLDDRQHTPRRAFIGAVATGTMALASTRLGAIGTSGVPSADDPWLSAIRGKHKQVFDITTINNGVGLMFAHTYVHTMAEHYRLGAGDVGAFVVARYAGSAIALDDSIWSKYRLGQMFGVTDPVTKAPSTRNLFYRSKDFDMPNIDASVDRLIASGVVVGVCGHALGVLARSTAARAGVTPEVAVADWRAGVLPDVHIVPSGVLAVARAQEAGCTYCFGG
jgi:intracellular sulfur oxidation DsrE/DsrF family protein